MRTREAQIEAIKQDQRFWRDLAAEVGPERYADPGPMGDWTFADMAAHLVGWRNRSLNRLDALARGEADPPNPWPADLDEDTDEGVDAINAWIQAQHAGQSPADMVAAYDASYDRLVDILQRMPGEKLSAPNAVPWLEGSALIDLDFTGHLHEEHVPSTRAWLDAQKG